MFNEFTHAAHFDKALKQLPAPPQILSSASAPIQHQYVVKSNELSIGSVRALFARITQCPVHHETLRSLLSVVYAVQLGCMQALVWNRVGESIMSGVSGGSGSGGPYNGSALDFLPCSPSQLLPIVMKPSNMIGTASMMGNGENENDSMGVVDDVSVGDNDDGWCEYARRELERAELCVRRRSLAVETRWASDKLRPAAIAIVQAKVINIISLLWIFMHKLF